jgi:hypothetical protein
MSEYCEDRSLIRDSENREGNQRTNPAIIEQVIRSLEQIRYGELVITIHDAKVVQIEKREKTRFHD